MRKEVSRRQRTLLKAVATFFVLPALAFSYGVVVGKLEVPPHDFLKGIAFRYGAEEVTGLRQLASSDRTFESIFLRLESESVAIPAAQAGAGGGLTANGDFVLVLTRDGSIYTVSPSLTATETAIEVPDNGLQDYIHAAKRRNLTGLAQDYANFRYKDVLYFQSALGSGLVISYTEFDGSADCYLNVVAVAQRPEGGRGSDRADY